MRRKDREVTDFNTMLEIMRSCDCCRLGLADCGSVYIVPLNFGIYERDGKISLYFHCADKGRKIDLINSNGSVGFEMDTGHRLVKNEISCECTFMYRSIIGSADAVVVSDDEEKIFGLQRIMEHYGDTSSRDFSPAALEHVAVLRLDITDWSCKQHV
ncbi:MAG: pyridoxamine 5'-phosphate oxidase family protein [Clostridia bacterium]|nr:pyridoxamine 5'-phosphate oxidase family protein [Clostridia bacterium]